VRLCRRACVAALTIAIASVGACSRPAGDSRKASLVGIGDILLAREVAKELRSREAGPWQAWPAFRDAGTLVLGNLEGGVGPCAPEASAPCFGIDERELRRLGGSGLGAVSLANNHAADGAGAEATLRALRKNGVEGMTYDGSPYFLRAGDLIIATVALDLTAAGKRTLVPSLELAEKLRLARTLSHLVVVSIHWGSELLPWPSARQESAAHWLVQNGADVIFGHHPHVPEPAACIDGRPVFYSLGNHLFDQKYPETKTGLVAECSLSPLEARCGGRLSQVGEGSFLAHPGGRAAAVDEALAACAFSLHAPLTIAGTQLWPRRDASWRAISIEGISASRLLWRTPREDLLGIEELAGEEDGGPLLLATELHPSDLDGEVAPRPHVYRVTAAGLVAAWRGTALAWPLLAVRALGHGRICACHQGGSFLAPDAGEGGRRRAVYAWNGFGFDAVDDAQAAERCAEAFGGLCSSAADVVAPPPR
jgi:hypothetical protein